MRSFRPNSRGMITGQKNSPITICSHAFDRPSKALSNLDRLLEEKKPRILICRNQGGIGDVLMTLPTVRAICKKYDCQIDYATDFQYLDGALQKVLIGNPCIKNIISKDNILKIKDNYDIILDVTCPCVVHEKPKAFPINRIDLFANYVGIKLDSTQIDYYIQDEELKQAKNYIESVNFDNHKLILVQPFSSTIRRDAPIEKIQRSLANVLSLKKDYRVFIVTHDSDFLTANWNFSNINILQNKDIREIAAIMHYCDLIVCPDSSILHLAGALKKRTLSFFGPTDYRARINHYPNTVAVVPGHDLQCFPCWYNPSCKDSYLCWKRMEEKIIVDTMLAMLENRPFSYEGVFSFPQKGTTADLYEIL